MEAKRFLSVLSLFFAACTSPEPVNTRSASDLRIDLVNPAIAGTVSVKTDSVLVEVDTAHSVSQIEVKKPVEESDNQSLIKKGAGLIETSGCLGCHRQDVKLLGPAYADVAKKYPTTPANIAMLVAKVKNGGSGVWGEIPMPPNPFSEGDVKAMVVYILSLK